MDRNIELYNNADNRKFPPVLIIYGKDVEIDNTFFDIGLKGAYKKYINTEFARNRVTDIRDVPSPYGTLDVYVRILDKDVHSGNIAMVITPGVTNNQGISSLQGIVEVLSSKEEIKSPTVPNLQAPVVQPV